MLSRIVFFLLFSIFTFSLIAQPASFTPHGSGGGGYMYAPSISPHDPDLIYLNCDMAGVYYTENGGSAWTLKDNQQLTSTTKSKMQFTSDPAIMYTIQRSLNQNQPEDAVFRGEPMKSINGGLSWQEMNDPTATGAHRILADPGSTQRILINEYDRLFFSNNGGVSFTQVFFPNGDLVWLGGAFWDGQNIYVGTNHGLLVSHNNGSSFAIENITGIPAGSGFFHLTGAKVNNTIRLFATVATASELYPWNEARNIKPYMTGVYRLTYGGTNQWSNIRNNIPPDDRILWIDNAAANFNTLWIAADNDADEPKVYKSTNGGNSWVNTFLIPDNQNLTTGWGGGLEGAFWYYNMGAAWGIDVDDNDPDHVILSDGYTHITTDGGNTWHQQYVTPATENAIGNPSLIDKFYQSSGLNVTTGHHIHFLSGQEMLASCTDIGNQYSNDGGQHWSFARNTFYSYGPVANNNWYMILKKPGFNTLYGAISGINDMYQDGRICDDCIEFAGGMILSSEDNGIHWDTLHDFGHPVIWLAISPANTQMMFASVVHHSLGGIYRTMDGGFSWVKLPDPPRTEGRPNNIHILNDGSLVVTYAARPVGGIGSDTEPLSESSGVFYSTDNGNSWSDRTAPAMRFFTRDIVIDPHDPAQDTWYATVWGRFSTFPGQNNQGNGGLYRSNDRGLTWVRIFEHERTQSCNIHPVNAGRIYVSVEFDGLYFSNNLNTPQPDFSRVTAYPFARPKRIFFNPFNSCEMWVTTMGGALWKGEETAFVPIISGDQQVCNNDILQYSIDTPPPGSTITWTVSGGEILSGPGTTTVLVEWNSGSVGQLSVTVE